MEQSTIALIILAIAVVLFATEKLPLAVTAIVASLAMYFTGILTFEQTFAGFSNNISIMVIAIGIIGGSFYTCGLSDIITNFVIKTVGDNEKKLIIVMGTMGLLLGIVFNTLIVGSTFLAIIDVLQRTTKGKITRKHTYLPVMMLTLCGGVITSISATSTITASGMLAESSFGRGFTFFEPFAGSWPAALAWYAVFLTFGYKYVKHVTRDLEDIEATGDVQTEHREIPHQKRKLATMLIILAICIYCFIFTKLTLGAVAMTGAMALIILGCIDIKTAISSVNWGTLMVVAGTLGFAKGVDVSGAGALIANKIIQLAGPFGTNAYAMTVIMLFLGTLLSNFMSNNSAVAIICPIAISIAATLGVSPLPLVLATSTGSNIAMSTPLATAIITMTTSAGYRFKDYVKIGGLINVLAFFLICISMYFTYYA